MQRNRRFWLFALIPATIFLTALLCVALFYRQTAQILRSFAYRTLSDSASSCALAVQTRLSDRFSMLESLASYSADPINGEIGPEHMSFAHTLMESGGFTLIGIVDRDGVARTTGGGELRVANRRYFISAMRGARSAEFVQTSQAGDDWRIVLAVPSVYAGRVRGAVLGSFTEHAMAELVKLNSYEGQAYSFIVDNLGNCIVSDEDAPLSVGENVYQMLASAELTDSFYPQYLKRDLAAGAEGTFRIDYGGKRLLTYTPLGMLDWYLFVGVEESAAMASSITLTQDGATLALRLLLLSVAAVLYSVLRRRSERRKQLQALRREADTDALTGLFNRAAFLKRAAEYLKQNPDTGTALLCIDIDRFKDINDTYGHAVGDAALTDFALALRATLRETDLVGRFGGDEFAVLLLGPIDRRAVSMCADKLIEAFGKVKTGPLSGLPASIGAALTDLGCTDFSALYSRADEALYEAKNAGRNRFFVHGDARAALDGTSSPRP